VERGDSGAIYGMMSAAARKARSRDDVGRLVRDERAELAERARAVAAKDARVEATARLRFEDGEETALELKDGRFQPVTLGSPPRRREDALRDGYRATFLHVLEGAPLPAPHTATIDLAPFTALAQLARDGLGQAAMLAKLARAKQPRIADLERFGRELEVLDRAIKEHGGMHPDTNVLCQMFTFGKENLEGDDVATLAIETAQLYRDLARGADAMTALLGGAPAKEQVSDARLHQ